MDKQGGTQPVLVPGVPGRTENLPGNEYGFSSSSFFLSIYLFSALTSLALGLYGDKVSAHFSSSQLHFGSC